jgi:hypothetical protein
MTRSLWVAAFVLASAGCHYQPVPVPVQADPGTLAALAGNWAGSYEGEQTGRTGSITFRITEKGDSAFGDVMMVPQSGVLPHPVDTPAEHLRHAGGPQVLSIAFVAISGDRVRGTLEPYVAPDCQCRVVTTFTGAAQGDRITGTFTTRTADGVEQTGQWRVSRQQHP